MDSLASPGKGSLAAAGKARRKRPREVIANVDDARTGARNDGYNHCSDYANVAEGNPARRRAKGTRLLQHEGNGPQLVSAAMHSPTMRSSPRRLPTLPKQTGTRALANLGSNQDHHLLQYTSKAPRRPVETLAQYQTLLGKLQQLAKAKYADEQGDMRTDNENDSDDATNVWESERGQWSRLASREERSASYLSALDDLAYGHLAFDPMSTRPAQHLDLRHWREAVSDHGLDRLTSCTRACRDLDLRGIENLTDGGLIRAVGNCPHLERLRIAGCKHLSDAGIESALSICGNTLAELDLAKYAAAPLGRNQEVVLGDDELDELWCKCCKGPMLHCADESRAELLRADMRRSPLNISAKTLAAVAQHCPTLEILVLREQREIVSNLSIALLAKSCVGLRCLDLGDCLRIGQEALRPLGEACGRNLQDVRMDGCNHVNDEGLHCLAAKAFGLRYVDLSGLQKISDDGLRMFMDYKTMWGHREHPGFQHVHTVILRGCQDITDISLGWIASGCPLLETLDMQGCRSLGDFGMRSIGGLNHLKVLNMARCEGISDAGVFQLVSNAKVEFGLRALPELHTVVFSSCHRISSKSLSALVETLAASLTRLEVADTGPVSDEFVRLVALHCGPRLGVLRLAGHSEITAAGLGALGKRCKYLYDLDVSRCALVGNDSLLALQPLRHVRALHLSQCPSLKGVLAVPNWKLQVLALCGCADLNDASLVTLLGLCQELRTLEVGGCTGLTSHAFEVVAARRRSDMPPGLDMVNVRGCSLVSDATMRRLASACSDFGLACSFVKNASWRGIQPDLERVRALHAERQVKRKVEMEQAALVVQCLVRRRRAYKVLQSLRHEDFQRRVAAAIEMQRCARGYLARVFAAELRQVLTFLALRIQFMYRQYHAAKVTRRALAVWTQRLLSRCFFAWRENAESLILQRRTAAAMQLAAEALAHFSGALLKRSWTQWQAYVAHRRWKNERYPKALAFFTSRASRRCFDDWKENARPGILRRKNLVKVFLLCVPLEVRNAQVARSNVFTAKRYFRRSTRSTAFRGLKAVAKQAKRNIKLADELRYKHFLAQPHGPAAEILHWWRKFTVYKLEIAAKARVLVARLAQRRQALALCQLAYLAGRRALYHEQRELARDLFGNVVSQKAFRRWVEAVQEAREMRAKAQKALAFMKDATLARTLRAWRAAITLRKSQEERIGHALARISQRALVVALESWKSAVAARKDFRRRAIQRMAMRTASRCLSQWKVFAVEERVRRCAQLESWKLLNRTVVRIQARWRGVLGREQVEDTRLMAQLMATRIQQFSRIVLAKKRAFRAERMKILHEYVAAEREQDLMAIEDYVAHEMQREFKAARLVQRHFRARYARDVAYYAKRELARAREIRRRERQHELMLEHEAKVAARQKEQERREAIASKIQAAARGMLARKRYMVLWARGVLGEKATMIQCAFRQRAAMHRYAATKRWSRLLRETARQQRTNARALRAMMLRNRSQQKMAQGPLDALGIHPDTFTLDLAKLRKEVLIDFRDWTRFARSEFEAYRQAGFNENKRQEIIRAFYERVKDEQWIRKGDAIRIISRQSPYRGETGFVLNVHEVATVPGGAQAAVKLDRNGAILFVPLMTVPTASEDSVSSMIRVKRLDKDWAKSKVTPELVASNQEAILAYAKGLAAERRRERAALVIQRHFRGRKWRAYFREAYVKQQRVDAARQQKLLRILRRLGLENARTGRLLVALGLVWPRYVPEMPDKPFAVEIWARKRQMNYEAWKYRRFQVLLAQDERERRIRMLRRRFRSDGVGPGESDELPAPMPATPSRTATPSNARTPQGTPSNATRANTPSAAATTGDRDPLTEEATSQATALQLAGFSNNHIPLRGQMLMDFMVTTGTNISEEQEAAMPWRVRNPFKAAFWRGVHTLTDRALAPTAERILALSIKKKDAGEIPVSVLLRLLAKAVGGPQWRRSPIDRLTWVGVYRFDQLVKSCHVTMDGTAVFHGTWSPWGIPHGVGFLELPEGDGLARIKSKYAIYLLSTSKNEEEGEAFRKLMEDRKLKRKQTWMEKTRRRALDVSRVLNDTSKEEDNELEDDDELEGYYTDTDDEADADPDYVGRKGILATLRSSSEISAQIPQTPVMKRRQNTDSSLEGFSDESGPNDLLYTSIKTTVENGIITGKVTINFKTGEMYEGAYFGESPSAWLMANRPLVEKIQLDANDDVESWLPSEEEFDDLPSVNRWTTPTGIVYEGESVTHHFRPSHPQGLMRITWPDDEVYFGEMVEGKKCGLGRSIMHDGDEYKGQWKDDTPHGVGVYYWEESRTAFAGQFVKGVRQGRGRQTFANGSRYDGEFVEDQPTGEGTLTRPNGDLYAGSFVEGEFHGHGLMKYADGTEYEGSWRRGMRHSGLRETSRFVNSEGDIYHVPFVNDEMDGQGSFLQAKLNPWRLERHGVWRRGQLSHWVGVSINKASTDEFCSRFVTYADYSSEYASIVAQSLPELPSGVDPDDRRVEQHVNGILRRAGPLASASIVDRSERALAEFQPLYDSIVGARDTAQANLTQAEEMHKAAKAAVDVQDALFEARSEELAALTTEIKDFWKRGTKAHACKRAYKRAVRKLKQFSTLDWFACKMANFTPPLWTSLWHAIAKIYLTELDKRSVQPSDVERLCNSSSMNRDFGEHSALLRDYDIKLLDEIEQYNVYERSKAKHMLRDVVSTVHHRDLNPRNSELAQICGLASPLVAFLHASYNYTMAAKGIAHVMDAALAKLDETDRVRALLGDCKEKLHACEIQVHDCDRAHQLADLEVRNSEVRLHEIQLNLKRARECQELAAEGAQADQLVHKFTRLEERDEDPIFPWISREEEVIFNACLGAVEYMLDLVCNIEPEVWDCVWTLKEITVGHFQYQDAYGVLEDDPEFVPEEVRDAVGDLVNRVAGFRDGAELEVHDALNDILYTLQGGAEPEVCEALDTAVSLGIEKFLFEDRAEKRQAKFKDQRIVVTIDDPYGGPGIRKFGLCLETYDYQMPIPAPPTPGTGVIYCEVGDTQVYGFEDTCQFLSEIRIGDVLCLPDADSASGVAERAVVGIWYDYHLEIEYPFPDALVAGGWTKQWAFRQPDAVLEYIPKEMVSVQLDEGTMLEVELDHVERADDGQGDQDSDEDDSEDEDSEEDLSSIDDDDNDDDDAGNAGSPGVKGQVNRNVDGTERRRRRSSASRNRRGSRASRASRSSSNSGKSLEIWQRFEDESGNAYWSQINSDDVAASSTWEQPLPGPQVWFQYEDEATGFFYFHNPATNETTWIEPF